jgi:hypothetical protein
MPFRLVGLVLVVVVVHILPCFLHLASCFTQVELLRLILSLWDRWIIVYFLFNTYIMSGMNMNGDKPVRCQKCGKPIGFVTVLAKGLLGVQQRLENVKVVAICMECHQKKH